MATRNRTPQDGETLFFIPDIGGFTKFVAETEITHAQHLIKDLLEAIVDANAIDLEVSEFEGDAVLFFRRGTPPALPQIVDQARRMFVAFHTLLANIETHRVCQCGACSTAHQLKLKIVAHHGSSITMPVKDREKLLGRDVIVAHRLLKNSVPEREYLLLTEDTLVRCGPGGELLLADGRDRYDELGEIPYRYHSLAAYHAEVKVAPPPPLGLDEPTVRVLRVARRIAAPAEAIYQLLIDLPARVRWVEGVKTIESRDDQPNHVGKVHRCVRDGSDPEVVTSEVRNTPEAMELWETDVRRRGSCRYRLERIEGGSETEMAVEFFVRRSVLAQLAFRLLLARKLARGFERSLDNLARLFERPRAAAALTPG